MAVDNMTKDTLSGIPLRYLIALAPIALGLLMLSPKGEALRRKFLIPGKAGLAGGKLA